MDMILTSLLCSGALVTDSCYSCKDKFKPCSSPGLPSCQRISIHLGWEVKNNPIEGQSHPPLVVVSYTKSMADK